LGYHHRPHRAAEQRCIRTAIRRPARASCATRCAGALSHSIAPPPRAAVIPEATEPAEQQ